MYYNLCVACGAANKQCSLCVFSKAELVSTGFNPQFIPKLEGISTLFSRLTTAASVWVHILIINLFMARQSYLEGEIFIYHSSGMIFVPPFLGRSFHSLNVQTEGNFYSMSRLSSNYLRCCYPSAKLSVAAAATVYLTDLLMCPLVSR